MFAGRYTFGRLVSNVQRVAFRNFLSLVVKSSLFAPVFQIDFSISSFQAEGETFSPLPRIYSPHAFLRQVPLHDKQKRARFEGATEPFDVALLDMLALLARNPKADTPSPSHVVVVAACLARRADRPAQAISINDLIEQLSIALSPSFPDIGVRWASDHAIFLVPTTAPAGPEIERAFGGPALR